MSSLVYSDSVLWNIFLDCLLRFQSAQIHLHDVTCYRPNALIGDPFHITFHDYNPSVTLCFICIELPVFAYTSTINVCYWWSKRLLYLKSLTSNITLNIWQILTSKLCLYHIYTNSIEIAIRSVSLHHLPNVLHHWPSRWQSSKLQERKRDLC